MNLFDTHVKPEENVHLFSVEYIANLWTSNEDREEEPILFSIRDKVDAADSIEQFFQSLSELERSTIEELLYEEQKWCKETLDEEMLSQKDFQQICVLNQAYQETIQFVNNWKAVA